MKLIYSKYLKFIVSRALQHDIRVCDPEVELEDMMWRSRLNLGKWRCVGRRCFSGMDNSYITNLVKLGVIVTCTFETSKIGELFSFCCEGSTTMNTTLHSCCSPLVQGKQHLLLELSTWN